MPIRSTLLCARALAPLAPRAARPLTDVGQVLYADQGVRVGVHDTPTDQVVASLLQPSLSPRDHDHASCRRASAFLLQALPQSRIVVRLRAYLFAGKEGRLVLCVRGDGQVALAHVH